MKSLLFTIVAIFGILPACFSADTEWNKEIRIDSAEPGGTPVVGIMNLSGIGAVVNKKEGKCIITKFFEESGAEAAGLKVSDIITHIDSKDIANLDLLQIVALLRGQPDTTVVLTIERTGEAKAKNFTVTRHPVKLK